MLKRLFEKSQRWSRPQLLSPFWFEGWWHIPEPKTSRGKPEEARHQHAATRDQREANRRLCHPRTHTHCYQRRTHRRHHKQNRETRALPETAKLRTPTQQAVLTPPAATPEEEHKTDEEFDSAAHTSKTRRRRPNARENHRRDLIRCRMKRDSRRYRPQASPNTTILDLSSVTPDLMRWTTTPSAAEDRDDRGEQRRTKKKKGEARRSPENTVATAGNDVWRLKTLES